MMKVEVGDEIPPWDMPNVTAERMRRRTQQRLDALGASGEQSAS